MMFVGLVLYKIAFVTFAIALGGILYQHIVEYRNWSAEVPESLVAYRQFFRVSDFGRFFKMFMPVSSVCVIAATVILWNSSKESNSWMLISVAGMFITAGFTNFFFVPMHRKLFEDAIDDSKSEELKRMAGRWKNGNYVRIAIMFVTLAAFAEALKILS